MRIMKLTFLFVDINVVVVRFLKMSLLISRACLAFTSPLVAIVYISCHGDMLIGSWEVVCVYWHVPRCKCISLTCKCVSLTCKCVSLTCKCVSLTCKCISLAPSCQFLLFCHFHVHVHFLSYFVILTVNFCLLWCDIWPTGSRWSVHTQHGYWRYMWPTHRCRNGTASVVCLALFVTLASFMTVWQ